MKRSLLPFSLLILASLLPVLADSAPGALDLGGWKLETLKGATANLSTGTDGPGGAPSLVVETQSAGSGDLWLVQLDYPTSVVKGKKYHLKFSMKCDPSKYVSLNVTQLHDPYAKLCDGKMLELSSDWKEIVFDFTPTMDETDARILLTNLNAPGTKFYLSKVTLTSE